MKKNSTIKIILKLIVLSIVGSSLWVIVFAMATSSEASDDIEPFTGAFVLFGALTALVVDFIYNYNNIRSNEAAIDSAFSNIAISKKRNEQLLEKANNLIDKYLQKEQDAVLAFANASKRKYEKTEKTVAKTEIETSIEFGQFLDKVPELRTNSQVQKLFDEILKSENLLQEQRMAYNDLIEVYNSSILRFPLVMVKRLAKLKKREYYIVDSEDDLEEFDDILN